MSKHGWWFSRGGAALLLALLLVGCAGAATAPAAPPAANRTDPAGAAAAAPAAAPAAPLTPIPVRFAYTALSTTITPYWIAKEAGYFRDEGVDLQDTFISSSVVGTQALIAREVDVTTVTGGAALQAAANGADIALFATNVGSLISLIMTAPDITRPDQLRGQSLGVVRFGTVSDFVARLFLRQWGLEPGQDVPLVQTGGQAETVAAMQNGAVRATSVADLPALELRRLGYYTLADASELGREYVGLGVIANRAYLKENEEATRRFVRALARGMARFVGDKEYSKRIIQQYTQIDDPEVLESSWQAHTTRYANRNLLTTPAAIRTVQEEIANDPRAAALDPQAVIENRFAQELNDSGFLASVYR
jgi:NitT/TauT family transport system substrate-binding protein